MIWLPPTSLTHLQIFPPYSLHSNLPVLVYDLLMVPAYSVLGSLPKLYPLSGKLFPQIVTQITISYHPGLYSWLTSSDKSSLANEFQAATLVVSVHHTAFLLSLKVLLADIF